MSTKPAIACPHCGKRYAMTAEYVAQYGGGETTCDGCGNAMLIPTSWAEVVGPDDPSTSPDAGRTPVLSYSAPDLTPMPTQGVWRDDENQAVVLAYRAKLPLRCFVCATPTEEPPRKFTLKWLDPTKRAQVRASAFVGGALMALIVKNASSQKVSFKLCTCRQHKLPKNLRVAGAVLFALACVVGAISSGLSTPAMMPVMFGIMGVLVLAGIVLMAIPYRLRVLRIDKGFAWIAGFTSAFRQSLPSIAEARAVQTAEEARRIEEICE